MEGTRMMYWVTTPDRVTRQFQGFYEFLVWFDLIWPKSFTKVQQTSLTELFKSSLIAKHDLLKWGFPCSE
ncbi:hypothetical protein GDO78_015014 [Eleutherodactylus coqui]|uniref:Uncharacterized protein n=1 Tax=Eleutherodactylus coqui TaxID=57060 RepID=A0A8J6ENZ9_ELECQ|nr:hypothetical protein GDO78_015014 [Eleutherodactylus coqui]